MKRAIDSEAWPHTLVMSGDWIVRWQGHPGALTAEVLDQIVKANRDMIGYDRSGRHRRS